MVQFLEGRRKEDLAGRLFRLTGAIPRVPAGLDELSAPIADLEGDGKGVPIPIKQYLKTGGKLLGFNVDRGFSNALDALILVDLRNLPPAPLERDLDRKST